MPCWREWESYTFGGIWQSVRLLHVPGAYIQDCFVKPNATLDAIAIDLAFCGDTPSGSQQFVLELKEVSSGHSISKTSVAGEVSNQSCTVHLPIANARHWSPDDPFLYELSVSTEAGDELRVRFGMKHLTMKNGKFFLNGKQLFIKGVFHEGLYPAGLPVPPNREFVEDELSKAKRMGFNLVRYWQIPIHPVVLDVADRMGMMLMDEPPIEWMMQSERMLEYCERDVRALVVRDRNRASVAFFTIVNEIGVYPFWHWEYSSLHQNIDHLSQLAHSLDGTRPIIDHSGGWRTGAKIYLPGESEGMTFNDCHRYLRSPTAELDADGLRHLGHEDLKQGFRNEKKGAPLFLSEFGYGSSPDLARIVEQYEEKGLGENPDCEYHRGLRDSLNLHFGRKGLDKLFASPKGFIETTQHLHGQGNAQQTLSIRSNPLASGYVMHALSAGGWILGAELLDMWRSEKAVCEYVRQAQKPQVLGVFLPKGKNYIKGQSVAVEVVAINDGEPIAESPLIARIRQGRFMQTIELGRHSLNQGIQPLWTGEIALPELMGDVQIEFFLGSPEAPIASGMRHVFVVESPRISMPLTVGLVGNAPDESIIVSLKKLGFSITDPAAAQIVLAGPPFDPPNAEGITLPIEWSLAGKLVFVEAITAPNIQSILDALKLQGTRPRNCIGNWSPVAHMILEREILAGLPDDKVLGEAYADFLPQLCIGARYQPQSAAFCLTYQPEEMAVIPTDWWAASTIFDYRIGPGKVVTSTFRLLQNIDSNPVAAQFLANLLALKFQTVSHSE